MKAKILGVEDDPELMRILMHTLGSAGYQVIPAYGAKDAARKVRAQKFDPVLTDLAMPEVNGAELIDDIKSDPRLKGIPVIAVTAHIWDGLAQAAGELGCDGFISKPFSPKALVREVEKYLEALPR